MYVPATKSEPTKFLCGESFLWEAMHLTVKGPDPGIRHRESKYWVCHLLTPCLSYALINFLELHFCYLEYRIININLHQLTHEFIKIIYTQHLMHDSVGCICDGCMECGL